MFNRPNFVTILLSLIFINFAVTRTTSLMNDGDDDELGVDCAFRAHPAGWSCGSEPLLSLRLVVSFLNATSLGTIVSRAIEQCENDCRYVPWCRAYSLFDLPQSLPTVIAHADYEEQHIDYYQESGTVGCKLYSQPACKILRWPGPELSVMVYKIAKIEGYDLLERRCRQPVIDYAEGPPENCAIACNASPLCLGFNYKFADNMCFLLNANKSIVEVPRMTRALLPVVPSSSSRGNPALPQLPPVKWGCRAFQQDPFELFFARRTPYMNQVMNDALAFEGFYAHDGNCRGGVAANFSAIPASKDATRPLALAISACPTCNTSIESCLGMCRSLDWCRGVSIFVGPKFDYGKPFCFLKSTSCTSDQIEHNAVYRFFERLASL